MMLSAQGLDIIIIGIIDVTLIALVSDLLFVACPTTGHAGFRGCEPSMSEGRNHVTDNWYPSRWG